MGAFKTGIEREFAFTKSDFRRVAKLVDRYAGISLRAEKEALVYGRLARRLRKLGLVRMRDYLDLLSDESTEEFTDFVNAITTNVTSFFREDHHFEYLGRAFLSEFYRTTNHPRRFRVWSAGCSKGMEPYSIAITLQEAMERWGFMDARILATDLNSAVLETAREGIYDIEAIEDVSKERREKWFRDLGREEEGLTRVHPTLQQLVTYRKLNLMNQWPMSGPFDAIFCRNVVIYFSRETQHALFDRFADLLRPGGLLILGHSETLGHSSGRFESCGKTIHRKIR